MVIGDFNARIGRQQNGEKYIGLNTADERNARGERMAAFAESHRLHVMTSYFEKPKNQRWTWHSPCFDQFNELDYILCDDRRSVSIVEVLSRLGCDSDHRPVRATLHLDVKRLKKSLALSSQKRASTFDKKTLKRAVKAAHWAMSGRTNERYDQLTTTLTSCLKAAEVPKKKEFRSRLTAETRKKLNTLTTTKPLPENAEEYRALAREVRACVKEDHAAYRNQRLVETAEARNSLKKWARELAQVRLLTAALKDENATRQTDRREIERICGDFYTKLFDSRVHVARDPKTTDDDADPLAQFTWQEVETAAKSMKNGKAPGPDGITTKKLKAGGPHLWKTLAKFFSHCLKTGKIPAQWKESKTVLIFKKGDPEDIANYRPICLLSTVYKVFTKTILNRLTDTLDAAQPPEQAGFRSGYCTLDHLQTMNQLQEKAREFGRHLYVVFVDYEKAFDSVEVNAVWNALDEQGVDPRYVRLLEEANVDCSTDITLFDDPVRIPIRRGVRQGDTISPKLFTAALESTFRELNWEADGRAGVSIDGKRITHLRFADDIALIGTTLADVQRRLTQLNDRSKSRGLRINRRKTEWFEYFESKQTHTVEGEAINRVRKYVYLGQELTEDHTLDGEITRRQKAAWQSYNSMKDALKNVRDVKLRANLFNTTVLPALLYGCETWAPTKSQENRIAVTQRSIERRTLGISMREEQRNEAVREQSQFADAITEARKRKLRWAGHVARMADDRWAGRTTAWKPRGSRPRNWGIPTRWNEPLLKAHGPNWREIAQNRSYYRQQCALHLERRVDPPQPAPD
ncbi:reverse transcriptase [Aphelenchoides avenae]|nr:reverse transcriptase [Aphelenchus avenae]